MRDLSGSGRVPLKCLNKVSFKSRSGAKDAIGYQYPFVIETVEGVVDLREKPGSACYPHGSEGCFVR